jgi:hypothetical protein
MTVDNDRATLAEVFARLALWSELNPGQTLSVAPPEIQQCFYVASEILGRLTEGQEDPWTGRRIDKIIRKSASFIVFLDPCLNIKWWWVTRPDFTIVSPVQARINELTHESAFLPAELPDNLAQDESVPAQQRYSLEAVNIRCVIGEAMALALTRGTIADCNKVLGEAERYIAVAKDQRCRPKFVYYFLLVVAVLAVASLAASLGWFGPAATAVKSGLSVQDCLEAAFAGCFGALISAVTRTTDLQLDPAAKTAGLAIEACARALIGAAAGILVNFAFHGGLLVEQALREEFREPVRLFLCLAAGISERILPTLVGKAEDIVAKKQNDPAAAVPRPTPPSPNPAAPPRPPTGNQAVR